MRWLLAGIFSALFGFAIMFTGLVRLPLTAGDRATIRQYEALRSALAHDQLGEAKSAAFALANNHEAKQGFVVPALAISQSETLDAAREHFIAMCEAAVGLVEHRSGFFVMHCSIQQCTERCENCPMDHFGNWVQVSPTVENPFMGKARIHCGNIKL